MAEITTKEKIDQFIKSNQDLLKIANEFQVDIYEKIRSGETDDLTEIVQNQTKGSIDKLQKKEFTITIVGEVKAGKSTLINALVGYDISHARTKAATTFPLRIKHEPHHQDVDFRFNPDNEFWQIGTQLQTKLKQLSPDELKNISEFTNTINFIKAGYFIKDSYNQNGLSIDRVRTLLESLHDFPRVYGDFFAGQENSIQQVMDLVHEIPEVVLEFPTIKHLSTQDGEQRTEGNVILIDTPGVGERGPINKIIQKLVKKEIAESSAVMAVLEKGGKNVDNEEVIQGFIAECKAPSYIIAGKMDDYDKVGNDTPISELLDQIKIKYSKYKLKDEDKTIDLHIDDVFAISQQDAVIGITALNYLEQYGALPNPYEDRSIENPGEHWVTDLIKEVHSRKGVKLYQSRGAGYEELFKETADKDYASILKEDYLDNPKYSLKILIDKFKDISRNAEKLILIAGKEKLVNSLESQIKIITTMLLKSGQDAKQLVQVIQDITPLIEDMNQLSIDVLTMKGNHENAINQKGANINNSIKSNVSSFIDELSTFSDSDLKGLSQGYEIEDFLNEEEGFIKDDLTALDTIITKDVDQINIRIAETKQELTALMEQNFGLDMEKVTLENAELELGNQSLRRASMRTVDGEAFQRTDTNVHMETDTVEEDGMFAMVQRGIGSLIDADWGYRKQMRPVIEKTEVFNRQGFLNRLSEDLQSSLDSIITGFEYYVQSRIKEVSRIQKHLDNSLTKSKDELERIIKVKQDNSQFMDTKIHRMEKMVIEMKSIEDIIKGIAVPEM